MRKKPAKKKATKRRSVKRKTTKRRTLKKRPARYTITRKAHHPTVAYDPAPSRTAARAEGDRRLGILRDHLAATYGQLHPSDWAVIARGGVVPADISRRYDLARKSGMTLNPKRGRRSAKRRNPWPALVNGFAAGLGLFAANQATTALRSNGKKKRRKKR